MTGEDWRLVILLHLHCTDGHMTFLLTFLLLKCELLVLYVPLLGMALGILSVLEMNLMSRDDSNISR